MGVWARLRELFALKPASQHELAGIQYIRAAAAIMVVLDHASGMTAEAKYFGRHPFASILEAGGQTGVDVFFCLSGFIIAYIALDAHLKPTMNAVTFYKRRFARIVPFMWLVIIIYAALRAGVRGNFPFWSYMRAFTLFPVGPVEPNVIWTLRHELLFYVIFGLTFLLKRRWLFAAWALSPLILVALSLPYAPGSGGWRELLGFLFNRVDLLFGLGVVVGLAYVKRRAQWPSMRWAPLAIGALLLAVFALADVWAYDRRATWQVLTIGVLSCLCIAAGCAAPAPKGFIGDLGRRFGDASYCIYLTHTAVISAILGLLSRHLPGAPDAIIMSAAISGALLFGLTAHYGLERPVVAWSQRLVFRRRIEGR